MPGARAYGAKAASSRRTPNGADPTSRHEKAARIEWAARKSNGLRLGDFFALEEAADGVAGLRALAEPILDALRVQLDFRGLFERVVSADEFAGATVTRTGAFDDHHAVKGLLFLANTS